MLRRRNRCGSPNTGRPAILIDTVDLVFELGAEDTRVKSRLGIRRNPAVAERGAALQLDGEALELVSLALDGEPLGANRYQLPPEGGLILADVPDAFTLEVETRIAPQSNTALSVSMSRAAISARSASRRAFAGSPISSIARM